jgi:hypothetical protein
MSEDKTQAGSELSAGLGEVKKTSRGFQYIEWQDRNGQACELQQSSAADFIQPGTTAVWLGLREQRMHLDLKQAKKLVKHLRKWIKDGVFA